MQRLHAGRNASREVLVSAATPHNIPNSVQSRMPSRSSSTSVSQKSIASNSAARLVSQTQRVLQNITDGSSTHNQQVQRPIFSLKHFPAIRKIGIHVNEEKMLLMLRRRIADALL